MVYKRFGDTIAIGLCKGDELLKSIEEVCKTENVTAGYIATGIGAVVNTTIGMVGEDRHTYEKRTINEEMEILALSGDISLKNDKLFVHAHIALGTQQTAVGAHLFSAEVSIVADVFIKVIDGKISRKFDENGFAVLDFPNNN